MTAAESKDSASKIDKVKEFIIVSVVIVVFTVLIVVFGFWSHDFFYKPDPPAEPKTAEQIQQEKLAAREKLVESQFSAWDGSHPGLTKLIKGSMNDPKSYEHVGTRYTDNGDQLIIQTDFHGKNAFGAVVKNSVIAKVDLDGNVIEVLSQSP